MAFQKGRSGNPGGRPKKTPELKEVEELARAKGPEAIRRLAFWMKSADPKASVPACNALLNRGFGMPTQPTENETTVTITDAIDRPPQETREQWIERRNRELGHALGTTAGTAD